MLIEHDSELMYNSSLALKTSGFLTRNFKLEILVLTDLTSLTLKDSENPGEAHKGVLLLVWMF